MSCQGANSETGLSWSVICLRHCPGRDEMNIRKFFNSIFVLVLAFSLLGSTNPVFAQGQPPRMEIDIYGNHIFASDWIVGSYVTVSFDVPNTELDWDYSKTVTVPDGWGAWCQFQIDIDPAIFRIASGQTVSISDGVTTREATIPDFSVTSEDPTADTISGTAPAGSTVNLFVIASPGARRNPVADSSGHWFADFAHPGTGSEEQDIFDVIPGTGSFWVTQSINDFVGIRFFWDFGPYFHVFPEEGRVETYVWPWGVNLTLTIDDPTTK